MEVCRILGIRKNAGMMNMRKIREFLRVFRNVKGIVRLYMYDYEISWELFVRKFTDLCEFLDKE